MVAGTPDRATGKTEQAHTEIRELKSNVKFIMYLFKGWEQFRPFLFKAINRNILLILCI
jgi:hypothetical protein